MNLPIIAVSIGDAAGIGPELTLKVLSEPATYERCRPFLFGAVAVMQQVAAAGNCVAKKPENSDISRLLGESTYIRLQ